MHTFRAKERPTAGSNLKRKSFFVDEAELRRARKVLGVSSDAEAVRLSLKRVVEMEAFWQFMKRTAGRAGPGAFEEV